MSDIAASLKRQAAAAACLILIGSAVAFAQEPLAVAPTEAAFLPRTSLHISIASLSSDDQRFSWDTHAGGDFDVVDYVYGRATLLADYQAVLGSEFRPFDPNQGNYTLAASGSARIGDTEIAGVLHHVSRHLSDRPKRFAIAWNALGGRVMRHVEVAGNGIDVRADLFKVIAQSYVDYDWTGQLYLTVRRPVAPHVEVYGHGRGDLFGVDTTIAGRNTQRGGRLEGGLRFTGKSGALDLFGGFERIIDADPIVRGYQQWGFVGFRVSSR